jgi:hypothetical protein
MEVAPPSPDPTLVAEQKQAQAADTQQVQQSLGQDTQNLWNMFGNGTQLSYIAIPGVGVSASGLRGMNPAASSATASIASR